MSLHRVLMLSCVLGGMFLIGSSLATTLTFCNGVGGYSGIIDSYVDRSKPGYNEGGSYDVWLHGQTDEFYPLRAGLMKFQNIFGNEPNKIPSGYVIRNAKLRLYLRTELIGGGMAKGIKANPLLVEVPNFGLKDDSAAGFTEVTWQYRSHAELKWGASTTFDGPVKGLDYDPNTLAAVIYACDYDEYENFLPKWIEIDITNIVSKWYSGEMPNYGLILRPGNDQTASFFRASDWPTIEERPQLVIEYGEPVCGDFGFMSADFSQDCNVNVADMEYMAGLWLGCTTPGGQGCVQVAPKDPTYKIPAGNIVVDGSLADWSNSEWIMLDKVYDGTPDDVSSAKFAVKWNDTTNKIYIAAVIEDVNHVFTNSYGDWNVSDRLEIYFSINGGAYQEYQDYAQEYIIGHGLTNDWATMGGATGPNPIPASFSYVSSLNGNQIIYEAAFTPFEYYGGLDPVPDPDIIRDLIAGDHILFDVVAGTKLANGDYGMWSENTMTGKYWNTQSFRTYSLVVANECGDWGYLETDLNQDCKTNIVDFAFLAQQWLGCTDPDSPCNYSLPEPQYLTKSFRFGVNDYTNIYDTFIRRDGGLTEYNYGGDDTMQVFDQGDQEFYPYKATLMKFDQIFGDGVNQISAGKSIISAKLRLFLQSDGVTGGSSKRIGINPLLVNIPNFGTHSGPAAVGEVTWLDRAQSQLDWGTPNDGPKKDIDYNSNSGAFKVYYNSNANGFLEINITDFVKKWHNGSLANNGLIIRPMNERVASYFSSSEASDMSKRPELVVEYISK